MESLPFLFQQWSRNSRVPVKCQQYGFALVNNVHEVEKRQSRRAPAEGNAAT